MFSGPWLLIVACATAVMGYRSSYSGLNFYFPNTTSPRHFNIHVDQDFIDLTMRKVRDYRPARGFYSDWTIEGPPDSRMQDLAAHWAEDYNWREVEERINKFDHYATTVPGNRNYTSPIPLHFIHHRSKNESALPLLLLHGWTSTHLEWSRVIKLLTEDNKTSFHIVAPDLPGNGFSPAPTQPGMGAREMGIAVDALMKQLGYHKYGLVGTDAGWLVGRWMVEDAHDSITGFFTDFFADPIEASDLARQARNETTEEENQIIAAADTWFTRHSAYWTVQDQKPLTLSVALSDSPVGFAGWMWDIMYAASDGYPYSNEEIITNTMLLWVQEPFGHLRIYREISKPESSVYPKTDVPTGVVQWGAVNGPFPDLVQWPFTPKDWIERTSRLVYFKRYEFGGHYPAVSYPDLWAESVGEFFSAL